MLTRFIIFLCLLLSPSFAHATIYWAAANGDNAEPCANMDGDTDPGAGNYGTILQAAKCMTTAGDVMYIKAGTYTGANHKISTASNCTGNCLKSGTSEVTRTIIMGAPGEARPQINIPNWLTISDSDDTTTRQYITIKDVNVDGEGGSNAGGGEIEPEGAFITIENVFLSSPYNMNIAAFRASGSTRIHHLVIRNNRFQGQVSSTSQDGSGYCVYIHADDALIENNECYDQKGGGFQIYHDGPQRSDRAIVRYNYIHDMQAATQDGVVGQCFGMALDGNNVQVYGNIFDGSVCAVTAAGGKYGLSVSGATSQIYNNLFYSWVTDAVQISGGTGHLINNNILFDNGSGIATYNGATISSNTHNACSAAQSCGTSKITISALTDITVSTSNFRHKSGSVGINAGTTNPLRGCNGVCDLGPFETFGFSSATVNENTLDVTLAMSVYTPVSPSSGQTTWTVNNSRSVTAASKLTGTDSVVRLTFDGAVCAGGQTWTVTYAVGTVTDSAAIGGSSWANLNQPMFAFSGQSVTNSCGSAPPAEPGTPHVHFALDDGELTTAADSSGNGIDGTLVNSPAWSPTGGKNGDGALVFATDTNDYVSFDYGNGVTLGSQSLTIAMGILPTSGLTSSNRIFFSAPSGTNQRLYLSWSDAGTYTMGVQETSGLFGVSSEFPVIAEWTHVCLVIDSGTNTATLHINGVAGTSAAAVEEYTDFSLAGNFNLGALAGAGAYYPGITIDYMKIWTSVVSCADDYAAWNVTSPTPTGTFEQKTHKWQRLRKKVDGSAEDFTISGTTNGITMSVVVGGAIALVTQIDCTVADCDPTGARLYYSKNGGSWLQVPDVCVSDGVCFYGTPDVDVVSGTVECCLSGALTENDGPTNTTASATPVFDLAQNGSFVRRSILKFGSSVVGGTDQFCFKEYHQTDLELNGGYTPSGGACVTILPMSMGVGF